MGCPICGSVNLTYVGMDEDGADLLGCLDCEKVFHADLLIDLETGELPCWADPDCADQDGETGVTGNVGDPGAYDGGVYGGDPDFWLGYPWKN